MLAASWFPFACMKKLPSLFWDIIDQKRKTFPCSMKGKLGVYFPAIGSPPLRARYIYLYSRMLPCVFQRGSKLKLSSACCNSFRRTHIPHPLLDIRGARIRPNERCNSRRTVNRPKPGGSFNERENCIPASICRAAAAAIGRRNVAKAKSERSQQTCSKPPRFSRGAGRQTGGRTPGGVGAHRQLAGVREVLMSSTPLRSR